MVESDDVSTKAEARLYGAGQLRGMGYAVRDVRVVAQIKGTVRQVHQVE